MGVADTEYEQLVQEVFQALNEAEGARTITVQHNVKLRGVRSGEEHQIDVYWEFENMGVTHRVAVECKNYASAVQKKSIQAFVGVLDDIGDIHGAYATRTGYQKGAKQVAKQYGITLLELRHPTDEDWKGRMRKITITHSFSTWNNLSVDFDWDWDWIRENYHESFSIRSSHMLDEVYIEDSDGMKSVHDIAQKFVSTQHYEKSESGVKKTIPLKDNSFLAMDGYRLKVKAILLVCDITVREYTHTIDGNQIAKAIMIDVLSGKEKFFDYNGNVRDREPLPPDWEDEIKRLAGDSVTTKWA